MAMTYFRNITFDEGALTPAGGCESVQQVQTPASYPSRRPPLYPSR